MQLVEIAVVASDQDGRWICGMPDGSFDLRLEESSVQQTPLGNIPDDERLVVAATCQIQAVRREGEMVDSVAVTAAQGVQFNIRARPPRHVGQVREVELGGGR